MVLFVLTSNLPQPVTVLPSGKVTDVIPAADTFPVPHPYDKLLFYVQRTPNTNTIVYELNVDEDGAINKEEPVHVYWIRYQHDGAHEELSYLQKKFAYGLNFTVQDAEKMHYKLNFVSYAKRHMYLQRSAHDKKYHVYMNISGKMSILNRVFVKIEGGTFWIPNIVHVEMYGRDIATGKSITEIFKP